VNESLHPARLGRYSTSKRISHTAEQIIRKLKAAEQMIAQGKTVADVCRAIEVTQLSRVNLVDVWRQSG
jgi:hypothetical protein